MVEKQERKEAFLTPSGTALKRVYTPDDVAEMDYQRDIGLPGETPFTRGCYPSGYRAYPWMMRQVMGFGNAESTIERLRELRKVGGQSGYKPGEIAVTLVMDLPTSFCLDSDNPAAYPQVGRVGVAIDHYKDFVDLLQGLPLDRGFFNLVVHGSPPIITAMYIAAAEELGYRRDQLRGSSKNDPLQSHICERIQLLPIEGDVKLALDLLEFCGEQMPAWNPISLEGYGYRSSGCDAVLELAITLATAAAYIEGGVARGLDVNRFVPRISFFLVSGIHLLEEVAKFRAARKLWKRMVADSFGATNPQAALFRTFVCTNPNDYTAEQPAINIIRGAIQTLAAVLGGVQAISVTPYDEAHAIPTLEAHTLAIRTQQIVLEESGAPDTVDAFGGSYAIEQLTTDLEQKVWQKIEDLRAASGGSFLQGMIDGVKTGRLLRDIEETALARQKDIESGARVVVGQNKYRVADDAAPPIFKVNKDWRDQKVAALKAFKAARDPQRVSAALDKLREAGAKQPNIMPALIDVAKEGVTLEEVMQVLQSIFGRAEFWRHRPLPFRYDWNHE